MQSLYSRICFALSLPALLLGIDAPALAASATRIWEYYHTAWGARDGAPTGVKAIAQTPDGMLWLGTHTGLYRFDGVRFRPVRTVGGIDLPVGQVYALLAARNGDLWISHLFGGASLLRAGRARLFTPQDGLPQGTVTEFAEDAVGNVWAATTAGLFRWNGDRWDEIGTRLGLARGIISNIVIDPEQTIWLNLVGRIVYLAHAASHFQTAPWSVDGVNNSVFCASRTGVPWISTQIEERSVALRLSLSAVRQTTPADLIRLARPDADIDVVDTDGGLWVNSGTSLLRVTANPVSIEPSPAVALADQASGEDVPSIDVQAGFEDREGNIWLGTTGGIERFRRSRIEKLPLILGEITIVPGAGHALWVGLEHTPALERGLYELDAGMNLHRNPAIVGISASFRNAAGTVWVGGPGGLWRLDGQSWVAIGMPIDLHAFPGSELQALAEDSEHNLWVSITRHGLFHRTTTGWEAVEPPGVGPTEYPLVIDHDDAGVVFLGYSTDRVSMWSRDTSRTYNGADGVSVGSVLALGHVDGELWIGGVRGIERFNGARFEPLSFDVPSPIDGVTGILQSRRGDLWVNTNEGVIHVSAADLARARNTLHLPIHAELLNYLDGLLGSPTPIRPLPTVRETDDGRIWLATMNGLFWTEPSESATEPTPPTVLITDVVADRLHRDPGQPLTLAQDTRDLEIDYTATSLAVPERVSFKYRLVGRDLDWQEVGTRRTAYYSDLPPGNYTFEVTASNVAGRWNGVGTKLTFNIEPAVVQTLWFRALCVAAVGALLWLILVIRLRTMEVVLTRRIEQRSEARADEVTRMSRELFDSLLQGFQGIMFQLQALQQLTPSLPPDARSVLDGAIHSGDLAVTEARNAAQELRDWSPGQRKLLDVLISLGNEFGAESRPGRTSFEVIVEGHSQPLDPLVSDDIYRIAREAIRNAFVHARAQRVEAEISYGPAVLVLRIRDDGVGFASSVFERCQREEQRGIPGMRARAASCGGELNIWSEPGIGTELELRIPGNGAYLRQQLPWWRLGTS